MIEIAWNWLEIFIIAMAKLAPKGCELNPDDVVALPMDQVLVQVRDADSITFSWHCLDDARALAERRVLLPGEERASVSQLQGRYMKLACILLNKYAPSGIRLTRADENLIPDGKFLFEDGIEYKWLSVEEGQRLRKRERDHEGRQEIVSKGGL